MLSALASLLIGMTTIGPTTTWGIVSSTPVAGLTGADSARTPLLDVPYDSVDGRLLVPATINGHAVTLLLDYVTDSTMLTKAGLAKTGLSDGGSASVALGSSVLPDVPMHLASGPMETAREGGPQVDGILGATELTHFDLVVDGGAHRIRLYAIPDGATRGPGMADTSSTAWRPSGMTSDNCTPMLQGNPSLPHRVFFDLHANESFLTMFDPGAGYVHLNSFAGVRLFGLGGPGAKKIDGQALGICLTKLNCALAEGIGAQLVLGRRHVPIADKPVYVFRALPGQGKVGFVRMGLYGVEDRLFAVLYSTGEVCMGYPGK